MLRRSERGNRCRGSKLNDKSFPFFCRKKNPSSIYLFSVCDDDVKNAKREKELKFKELEDRLNKVCELELISQLLVK